LFVKEKNGMGLITEKVEVTVNPYTIRHYESLGYNLPRKENGKYKLYAPFTVKVEDLPKTSTVEVNYSCDYCGEILTNPYFVYLREISGIVPKTCCADCNHIKVQESNQITYGENTVLKIPEVKEKISNTVQQRYGVKHISQSKEIRERVEKTNLRKFGTKTPCENEEIKQKVIQTNNLKYGANSPLQNDEIKEKLKQTMLSRYGCENISQLDLTKEKVKNTQYEKYGMYYSQTEECKKRINNTCKEKYGNNYYLGSKSWEIKVQKTNMLKYSKRH
jgi:hypothetical protein